MGVDRVRLDSWLALADTAFNDSRSLMFQKISGNKFSELRVPAFLLHWSIELYLKAFLLNLDMQKPGHDLISLFDVCEKNCPQINTQNFRTEGFDFDQRHWVKSINQFGHDRGGFRYLTRVNINSSFYLMIHEQFDEMISFIKGAVDLRKDITGLIDPKID